MFGNWCSGFRSWFRFDPNNPHMLIEKASISTKGCQFDNNTNTNITKKNNVYFNSQQIFPRFFCEKKKPLSSNTTPEIDRWSWTSLGSLMPKSTKTSVPPNGAVVGPKKNGRKKKPFGFPCWNRILQHIGIPYMYILGGFNPFWKILDSQIGFFFPR